MEDEQRIQQDSPAWVTFVQLSFGIALAAMAIGILYLPVDVWIKGYLGMGTLFLVGSTITLAKTMRDQHESRRLIKRVRDAKTEKILAEYELKPEVR